MVRCTTYVSEQIYSTHLNIESKRTKLKRHAIVEALLPLRSRYMCGWAKTICHFDAHIRVVEQVASGSEGIGVSACVHERTWRKTILLRNSSVCSVSRHREQTLFLTCVLMRCYFRVVSIGHQLKLLSTSHLFRFLNIAVYRLCTKSMKIMRRHEDNYLSSYQS